MSRCLYLQVKHSGARVAEACFQLTPKVSLQGEEHLYLEISSTAKLFGGEMNLLEKADDLFASFLEPEDRRWVVCDRMEWAPACLSAQDLWIPPGKTREFLWSLSIQRISDPVLASFMIRVGLKKIGDFAALPADAVMHRFGEQGFKLHEWAWGRQEFLPPLYVPEERIQETVDGEQISCLETLLFVLRGVLVRFEAQLRGRGQAVKTLKFEFVLESSHPLLKFLEISDPCQEASALVRLLKDFFRDLSWGSPLVALHLMVWETVPHSVGQLSLFDKLENRFEDLGKFIGRLRGRFGEEEVGVPELLESYLPEKSWRLSWPPEKKKARGREFPDRPLFLLPRPAPFPFPERYELKPSEDLWTEWWSGHGPRRYFMAVKEGTPALWVYLDYALKKWFVHGTFD